MTTGRKIGLILTLIGLILTFGLLFFDMHDAYYTWHTGLNGKDRVFDSWFTYYLSGHTIACAISLAAGSVFFVPGCFLLFAPKSTNLIETNAPQSSAYTRDHREIM